MVLPPIASQLAGSKVLVTGVTGFVGLVLVEKLLRTVSDIDTIYVLIRPKRGINMHDRLSEIKNSSIFELLKSTGKSSDLEKIVVLGGSIDAEDLGLTQEDLSSVITGVNYVFHCAATLDFEASLKTTVEVNLLGTRRVIQLCKRMQQLKVLVHVSSAYVNADKKHADEILYPPPEDVNKVLELVGTLSDTHIADITPSLLKNHPNTYTFTKALAEHEVANAFKDFNACIVRPSMIVGAWKDPFPGWTNSKNGPQGFIMGAAMGVVRRLPVGTHLVYDYIPVDIVVNAMLAAAVYTVSNRADLTEIPIFHCTTSTIKPFRWTLVENKINAMLHKNPLMQALWYPHLKLLPSIKHYRISSYIFHLIPAYIFDLITKIAGGRPKLVRLHTNVSQSLDRLEPFIFQEWMFDSSRLQELHGQLAPTDRNSFGMDLTMLDWHALFEDLATGVRRYLHKEKESNLSRARTKNSVLMVLNFALQLFLFYLVWLLFKSVFGISDLQATMVLPFVYMLFSLL